MPIRRLIIPRRFDGFTLIIAAVALFGAAMVLYRQTAYGASATADSAHYIAMARNVLDGHGFLSFYGGYPPHWAPLTPTLYAVFSLGVFHPLAVAVPLNAALFALTVFTVGAWIRRRVESRFAVLWACLSIVFAAPIIGMFDWALSEPPFIFLTALALYWSDRHLEDGKRSSLAWAASSAALACLSRYSGVSLVAVVAAAILLRQGVGRRERLASAAAYSAVSLLPLCVWLARNWLNTGTISGERGFIETPQEHIPLMLEAMAQWWLPYTPIPGAENWAVWITVCAFALTAALAAFAMIGWLRTGAGAFVPLLVGFALAHSVFTLIGMSSGIADDLDRYVVPTYIPLLAAAALGLDRALAWARRRDGRARTFGRRTAAALTVALAAWTAYGGFVSALDARDRADGHQEGRTARAFQESETVGYLRGLLGSDVGVVFSNDPLQAHLASDGRGLYLHPPYHWRDAVEEFRRRDEGGETIIAWFHDGSQADYGVSAFHFSPGFEPLGAFADGDAFRLNPGYTPADPRAGTLIADSHYDVYLNDGALTWVRQPCSDDDAAGTVELWVKPIDPIHLPPDTPHSDGVDMNFGFSRFGAKLGDLCVIRRNLPSYPIRSVRTGQRAPNGGGEWLYRTRIEIAAGDDILAYYRAKYETVSAREPLARSEYDVYSDGGALVYLKAPCEDEHTQGRFLMSVFPVRLDDIPEDRREAGHVGMNFDFADYGARFDGKCVILRRPAAYPVAAVEIGRFIPGEGEVWRERIELRGGDGE